MPFPILKVPSDASTQLEQLGTKAKFWFHLDEYQQALFKEGRPGTGENWAEKICCEIAHLLGLPHAEYELALWRNRQGTVSPSLIPPNGRLILGNELLAKVFITYEQGIRYKSGQHTLSRVIAVLQQSSMPVETPLGWERPNQVTNASGVFTGYLLLDALVGNQDRHHENWGLISIPYAGLFLAPTFDHASSLGRNETDENRIARLRTKDIGFSVEAYVSKARSGFYKLKTSNKPMFTLEAFQAIAKTHARASQYWLDRLYALKNSDFSGILNSVPDSFISAEAKEFAYEMLSINRNRLLSKDSSWYL